MSSFWVRPATPLDGKAVRDLARRVVREFQLNARLPDPPPLAAEHDFMWVVEAGRGEIVGSCGLREGAAGEWSLHSLYLAGEFRGFGLGHSLVENALRVARQHGALKVVSEAPSEFHDAQALFERLGFETSGGAKSGARRYELVLTSAS